MNPDMLVPSRPNVSGVVSHVLPPFRVRIGITDIAADDANATWLILELEGVTPFQGTVIHQKAVPILSEAWSGF